MNLEPEPTTSSPWDDASRTCWKHTEITTRMVQVIDAMRHLPVSMVIPITSVTAPTLMVTPTDATSIDSVRDLTAAIGLALLVTPEWDHVVLGDRWAFRLKHSGISIDVVTQIPAVKEAPVQL